MIQIIKKSHFNFSWRISTTPNFRLRSGCRKGRASSSRGKINDSSDGTLNAAAVDRRMQRDKRGRPNNVIFPYAHLIRESAPTESIPPPPSMAWSNASVSVEEIEAEEGVDASLCGNSENLFVSLSPPATEDVNLFWAAKCLRRRR